MMIRSLIFNVAFTLVNVTLCLSLMPVLFLPRAHLSKINFLYLMIISWLERNILKLDYQITGLENLPQHQSYIVAMQHQSAWETFKLGLWFPDPAIVLKQELGWIPIWGWAAKKLGAIPLNRSGGIKALNAMIKTAEQRVQEKRPIVIFPQGTRVPYGQKAPYRIGVGKLYEKLNIAVLPVQLDSGRYWPKRSFLKKSGIIQVKINPAIQPGLKIKDFMSTLESVLEN